MRRLAARHDVSPALVQSEGSDWYATVPYADHQEQPVTVLAIDYRPEQMYDANPPWNLPADFAHRQSTVVDPSRADPLARENRELLVEMGAVMGREGSDWQNPYAWAARGVLAYTPTTGPSTGLVPAFGQNAGDNTTDLALNVRATAGVLQVGGGGFG